MPIDTKAEHGPHETIGSIRGAPGTFSITQGLSIHSRSPPECRDIDWERHGCRCTGSVRSTNDRGAKRGLHRSPYRATHGRCGSRSDDKKHAFDPATRARFQRSLRREDELSKWYKQLVLRSANQLGYDIARDPQQQWDRRDEFYRFA